METLRELQEYASASDNVWLFQKLQILEQQISNER